MKTIVFVKGGIYYIFQSSVRTPPESADRSERKRVRVSGERERERSPLRGLSSVNAAGGRGESERERG